MRKLLCLILAISMLLSVCAFSVNAQSEESYPFVLVRGMEFNGLTVDYGTEEAQPAIKSIDTQLIGDTLKSCIKGFFFDGRKGFVTALCDVVKYILGDMGMNADGTSTYNVSIDTYPLAVSNYPELINRLGDGNEEGIIKGAIEQYGADNCYYFRYDWRIDPYVNAQGVNDIIAQAKADHNSEKVNLVCCSMGGAITMTYLTQYGSESLNRVIFLSSAFCGTYVASDVLQGDVYIGAQEVYDFAVDKFPEYKNALTVLKNTYMLQSVTCLLNRFIEKNGEFVFDYVLRDIFGTMPAFWALVLPKDYEACINYIFPTDELKQQYKTIIELSESYQEMWAMREETLAKAEENGTTIAVVATYNIPLIPVYDRACTNGDGTLETALMLGGATVANYGETLYETYGEDYMSEDEKYISPDDVIDMSSALFPDRTWCFKNVTHISCNYGTDMQQFLFWLVNYDGQPTIESDSRYPQYILSSDEKEIRYFD